jgi:hypothetical protein
VDPLELETVDHWEIARRQSRLRLLRAGAELAKEHFREGKADPLRLLNPAEIAQRAGMSSRGQLYNLWPVDEADQAVPDKLAAYRQALLEDLVELSYDVQGLADSTTALADPEKIDLEEMVRAVAAFEFERYAFKPETASEFRFGTLMSIVAEHMLDDRAKAEAAEKMRASEPYAGLRRLYEGLLMTRGREMVEPLVVDDLVQALWCVLDGFTLNAWHFDRLRATDLQWRGTRGWSLFSISVLAVIDSFTRPATDDAGS